MRERLQGIIQKILSWLNAPLFGTAFLKGWMLLAAAAVLIAAAVVVILLLLRRKRKRKAAPVQTKPPAVPITEAPAQLPVLEIANLQEVGQREEQQDAFGLSPFSAYKENGLLAVLCDGMGGMTHGAYVSRLTVERFLNAFPWEDDSTVEALISDISAGVYAQLYGHGGSTLVAVKLVEDSLRFWCVGDSDLFLLRGEKLCALNRRQEYKNDLLEKALHGKLSVEQAYSDPQAGALSCFIGREQTKSDSTRIPIRLAAGDTLLLCSDGISDTLTLRQIGEALAQAPAKACEMLEEAVKAAGDPQQDNYTAIVIRYNGRKEE